MTRVAHTFRRRFWRRPGGPRAASPYSMMGGAGSAPQAGRLDTGLHAYGVAGAPGVYVAYSAGGEAAELRMGGTRYAVPTFGRDCQRRPQFPRNGPVAPIWFSLRRTGSQTPCGRAACCGRPCRSLPVPAERCGFWHHVHYELSVNIFPLRLFCPR